MLKFSFFQFLTFDNAMKCINVPNEIFCYFFLLFLYTKKVNHKNTEL